MLPYIGVAWTFLDRYLKGSVPETVNREIESGVKEKLDRLETDLRLSLRKNTYLFSSLAIASSAILALNLASILPDRLTQVGIAILYVVPLVMSVRFVLTLIRWAKLILRLEEEITQEIGERLQAAGAIQQTLREFYDARPVQELAAFATGRAVFDLIRRLREGWRDWLILFVSYAVSYAVLVLARLG